ncbi:AraC family transcriptional regulator [Hyphococcus sp. DH-69]|uniref:AraC family transcriptional regulator n=1 Tax=Hyphococcus formosus TaxID=3143534 RepID=UPI00398AE8A5
MKTSDIDALNAASPQRDLPLHRYNKLCTEDIDEIHAHMSNVFCDHSLTLTGGSPPIAFRHNSKTLTNITFNATDYGNPYGRVNIKIPPSGGIYLLQFTLAGSAEIIQNGESFILTPHQFCVIGPDDDIIQTLEHDYKHFTVKISKSSLEAALFQEIGLVRPALKFAPGPIDLKGEARSLSNLIRTICADVDEDVEAYSHERSCNAVEHAIKHLIFSAAPHNHSDLYVGNRSPAAPYYVRKVEEFIRANATNSIGLSDMTAISGVSARSLHTGFQQFRNTTPMRYLKEYRLQLSRKRLKEAVDRNESVTDVAMACGFTHLSKFARDYNELFGELPSQTLKKYQ